ncbi:MAG TPA: hypothetical protein VE988_01525 [Gemmataceae bacterium]|nr:hypothetical protein [Gemmataceae bacterium]
MVNLTGWEWGVKEKAVRQQLGDMKKALPVSRLRLINKTPPLRRIKRPLVWRKNKILAQPAGQENATRRLLLRQSLLN